MKKKGLFVQLILVLLVLSFAVACRDDKGAKEADCDTDMQTKEEFIQGFFADNSKPLSDILTVEYELDELQDFFGHIPPMEDYRYRRGIVGTYSNHSINNTNERFPIECTRSRGDLRKDYYSVYKVKGGGYYYVFWITDESVTHAHAYFTAYLPSASFRNASDFDSLINGISTAEDVSIIDPTVQLHFLGSSGPVSYSLLDDGTTMIIEYERVPEIKGRSDLVVVGKKVYEDTGAWVMLSDILPCDLP